MTTERRRKTDEAPKERQTMEPKRTVQYQSRCIYQIPIEKISPNPRQPRRHFEEQSMLALAESIRQHGILQPLSVQKLPSGCYMLVAGERRLRAAGLAGLSKVPCILVRLNEEESAVLALVENLQRCDLHYMEEAAAMARLISTYGLSQEETARRLGRSQSAVANKLRLLRLSPESVELLRKYDLTERHARAVLRLTEEQDRCKALCHMGERGMNVAAAEEYIESLLNTGKQTAANGRSKYIIKDVRLFLNSVKRSMDTMRLAGVDAVCDRQDSEDEIVMTIRIPKQVSPPK